MNHVILKPGFGSGSNLILKTGSATLKSTAHWLKHDTRHKEHFFQTTRLGKSFRLHQSFICAGQVQKFTFSPPFFRCCLLLMLLCFISYSRIRKVSSDVFCFHIKERRKYTYNAVSVFTGGADPDTGELAKSGVFL